MIAKVFIFENRTYFLFDEDARLYGFYIDTDFDYGISEPYWIRNGFYGGEWGDCNGFETNNLPFEFSSLPPDERLLAIIKHTMPREIDPDDLVFLGCCEVPEEGFGTDRFSARQAVLCAKQFIPDDYEFVFTE